jgi:hypothetical protein
LERKRGKEEGKVSKKKKGHVAFLPKIISIFFLIKSVILRECDFSFS